MLRIARALNEAGVTWGIGASLMLKYRGIVPTARDIDLVVAEADADDADAALRTLGEAQTVPESDAYATRDFRVYQIDGIEVDLMAGLAVRHGGQTFRHALDPHTLTYVTREGVALPLSPLEDWYVLYWLMPGRDLRVSQIEAYFVASGAQSAFFAPWLSQPLPDTLRRTLQSFAESRPDARN